MRVICNFSNAGMQAGTAFVYSGPGASTRSVLSTLHSLQAAMHPSVAVQSLDTAALLEGRWREGCRLLVMPGGADLPYCAHLNGHGNALIREYVEAGGSYLGLCAGAYYACARVEFEVGTRLEVQGDRELCFFPGIAKGSAYKGFEYESERGAVAAPVRFRRWRTQGQGDREWHTCRDYVNGGPLFYSKSGSVVGINTRLAQGTEVLATYPEHGHAAAALAVRVGLGMVALCSSHPELAPSWLAVPSGAGRSDSSNSSKPLNGSQKHSERDSMAAQDDWGQGTGDDAAVAQLRRDLEEHEAGRQALWRTLLAAAGLGNVLIEERVAVLK